MEENDTIAAISTPLGEGGIGIVKISGAQAKNILLEIFKPSVGKKSAFSIPRKLYHGFVTDKNEQVIDEVLAVYMPAPFTYTKEDVVEINCHSGIIALRAVLEQVLKKGARLAEPGEFTKRAFLKGRIDLSQAEAVMNMIQARSVEAVKIAARAMQGELKTRIENIQALIIESRAPIEAWLDYPEEYDELKPDSNLISAQINKIHQEICRLLEGMESSIAYQEGLSVAILGKPNVGKSSLLNALLRQQKAIVHEKPGTTRDILEGFMSIGGYPIRLVDTAGIAKTSDPVEKEGISRSWAAAAAAALIIYVIDGSQDLQEDEELVRLAEESRALVVVINKLDLEQKVTTTALKNKYRQAAIVKTSALKGTGIEKLEKMVQEQLDAAMGSGFEPSLIVSLRHGQILNEAKLIVENIIKHLAREPLEIISTELQHVYNQLSNITGTSFDDSLLDKIFSEFCLGK